MATTYSTTDEVKDILGVTTDQADSILDTLRERVYASINNKLRDYGADVPLDADYEDRDQVELSEQLQVAGLWRMTRTEDKKGVQWGKTIYNEGKALLDEFIEQKFTKKQRRATGLLHLRSQPSWEYLADE